MHNLFTPVEVIRNASHTYPPEALLRFEQELYAITQPRVLSLADERKKLLAWFRGLPLLERRHVATFNSPEFACMLGRLFEEWQMAPAPFKYQFLIREGKYFAKGQKCYKDYRHKEKELLEQVVLVTKSQLYEAITLSQRLLKEPEWLFELLDELQGGVVDTLADFDPQERATGQISFKPQSQSQSELLGVWIGTLILKQIALWFLIGIEKIEPICSHHRNQEKQYASLWSQLTVQQRQKLVQSAFAKPERQMLTEYSKSVEVSFEWLPRVYFESKEKHCFSKWISCPPKQFMNEVTYVPLIEAFSLRNIYRMELIIEVQSTLAEKKQLKGKKKNKKKKKKEQPYLEHKSQQHFDNTRSQKTQQGVQHPTPQTLTLKQLIHQAALHSVQEQSKHTQTMIPQTNSQIGHQLQNFRQQPRLVPSKSKADEVNANQKLEWLFKKIKEDNRQRYRKIILHRLTHILAKVGISCQPYGSFASQLSLPDSDLDISVNTTALNFLSFEYPNHRSQVILSLQFIANILKHYPWINNFSLLDKAKVPLLSFSADASVYFELGPDEKTKFRVNSKRIDPEKAVVQVDLTVQPFANTPELPHCGLQSTQSLKAWMQVFPALEKAIILMKALLRRANLHKTFQGGIGSYTISLLLIAFFRSREDQATTVEKMFDGFSSFLKKLITEKWLIDPEGELPVLRENITKEPFLRHPYDGHNLLGKCYRLEAAVEAVANWKVVLQLL